MCSYNLKWHPAAKAEIIQLANADPDDATDIFVLVKRMATRQIDESAWYHHDRGFKFYKRRPATSYVVFVLRRPPTGANAGGDLEVLAIADDVAAVTAAAVQRA